MRGRRLAAESARRKVSKNQVSPGTDLARERKAFSTKLPRTHVVHSKNSFLSCERVRCVLVVYSCEGVLL